ncbi:hypothetical protein ACPPVO_18305 [Dactylosporangium sp. McL0621]|uniref:hypothetical protein n=1 Tax=Dactylosporangium sp. McL0621 TaxID=3415678 RepID=UPI003CE6B303
MRPYFDTATATPVDVAGGRAWLDGAGQALFAEALDGRNVQLSTTSEGVGLARVARELDFGPVPDMTWYGGR